MAKSKRNITEADRAAAKKLRALWDEYKKKTRISQETAASRLGMSQAAFSQYLRCDIAMGTDALLGFAGFFSVSPSSIRADFGHDLPHTLQQQRTPYHVGISLEASEVARAFDALPKARQHIVREYIFLEAIIARKMPWLIRGRPAGGTYQEFERGVERDYHKAAIKEAEKS